MNSIASVIIDGKEAQISSDYTIIQAAEEIGVKIPSLCYHKELTPTGGCGICLVKDLERNAFIRACTTPVYDGMNVRTHSRELTEVRKGILELILSDHPDDCLFCIRSGNCELQTLAKQLGFESPDSTKVYKKREIDRSSPSLVREPEKCILCGRCISVCGQDIQTVGL